MRIHMIAVCGTGMGSLAGMLKAQGHEVDGCDSALYPPMSDALAAYGVKALKGFDPWHLDPPPDLVIIGNAVHKDNPEAKAAIDGGIEYLSMAEAVHRFAVEGRESLVVAGTHGKTTTTAICGFLLEESDLAPNVLVGGIVNGWESSFRWDGGEWTVLEGDEYETSFFDKEPKFLHYDPSLLLLNNLEMDHRDNFASLAELEAAFERLLGKVRTGGKVIAGTESPSIVKVIKATGVEAESFGTTGEEDWSVSSIEYLDGLTRLAVTHGGKATGVFESPLCGPHNARNVVGAIAACVTAGAPIEKLQEALKKFPGVRRRQQKVWSGGGLTVIDDFAHHPTAIGLTIRGLRQCYPGRKLVVCFEPRSYTCQTNIHQEALVPALSLADEVYVGPFNPYDKIPPGERLDTSRLVEDIRKRGVDAHFIGDQGKYLELFGMRPTEPAIVVFFSSGPFFNLPAQLANMASEWTIAVTGALPEGTSAK